MNGIEKITERIATDNDRAVDELLSQARNQAEEIRASYQAMADADTAAILKKGKADAEERTLRLGSVAALEAKKRQLAAKQESLDETFSAALEKLQNLPESDYIALLSKLAAEASTTGSEALVFSARDRSRYGKQVVVAANKLLAKEKKPAGLTMSEEARDFQGGLYLQDGRIETNCTFPTLIRMLREQMSGQVAKVLFN